MVRPKFSIITPSYNQGHFIEKTIHSIQSQNISQLEHIIIDGGSTDNTLNILRKYTNKIRWISEKDKGQANAINKGIKMATGHIIGYLNSDDIYLPNSLNIILNYFKYTPHAKWVTGDYSIIDNNGYEIQKYITYYKRIFRLAPNSTTLSLTNFIAQPSTFWKKEITQKIGYFNEEYQYAMDYDYWLRIIQYYPLHTVPNRISGFRIHRTSKGSTSYKNQFEEDYQVLKKYQQNKIILSIHKFHNQLIKSVYNAIKNNDHF